MENDMKTKNLVGAPLNWAVAKCEGHLETGRVVIDCEFWMDNRPFVRYEPCPEVYYMPGYEPSTNWEYGGPIIAQENISISSPSINGTTNWHAGNYEGATPLIAAMRYYVASKLGEEVAIPKELIK
jgi:hypothetical protein